MTKSNHGIKYFPRMSGQNKFSKINCGSCVRLYALHPAFVEMVDDKVVAVLNCADHIGGPEPNLLCKNGSGPPIWSAQSKTATTLSSTISTKAGCLAFKLPLEYMWEFYWFEFQDPSPSGLVANSRDTQILHKKCQGKNGYFFYSNHVLT